MSDQALTDDHLTDARIEHPPLYDMNLLMHLERDRQHAADHDILAPAADTLEKHLHRQLRRRKRITLRVAAHRGEELERVELVDTH